MPEAHTDTEEAYLEAFSIAMDDGIVTVDERKMLNLQAKTLGLDEERVNHLESFFLSQLEEE
jgi:tellurite resistance protein